jgi:hypothetical protein
LLPALEALFTGSVGAGMVQNGFITGIKHSF